MGEARLRAVFGTGQAGNALAADAADPEVAAGAAQGATVVYQCVNAPYTRWLERFRGGGGRASCWRAHRCAASGELTRLRPGHARVGTPREKEEGS